jgi:hypothetical protein
MKIMAENNLLLNVFVFDIFYRKIQIFFPSNVLRLFCDSCQKHK